MFEKIKNLIVKIASNDKSNGTQPSSASLTGYRVVNGHQLRGSVNFYDEYFWDQKKKSEEDYVNFLKASVSFFDKYQNGENTAGEKINGADAEYVYLHNAVKVKEIDGYYYFAGDDGRHRFMAAKNNNLDILVYVISTTSNT